LPEALRELFLASFPSLHASAQEIEVVWLEKTDFPRVRKEDLESDHPIVVMSPNAWRISHPAGEERIQPFEPIAIPARSAAPSSKVKARRFLAKAGRRAALPIAVGLVAFVLGLVFPAKSSTLEARGADAPAITSRELEELVRHWRVDPGEEAIHFLGSDAPSSSAALLRLVEAHHPAANMRAEAARLLRK
jgi:hypothetical protein